MHKGISSQERPRKNIFLGDNKFFQQKEIFPGKRQNNKFHIQISQVLCVNAIVYADFSTCVFLFSPYSNIVLCLLHQSHESKFYEIIDFLLVAKEKRVCIYAFICIYVYIWKNDRQGGTGIEAKS